MEVSEVFKAEPKKDDLSEHLIFLRRMSLRNSSWSIREIQQFMIDWQETTGKLLKAAGKPYEHKFADAEKKKKQLRALWNRGVTKK